MIPFEKQIEYVNSYDLMPYGVKAEVLGAGDYDCGVCYSAIRIDAFTLYHLPIPVTRKTIVGMKTVIVDGFSLDVHVGDGEIEELGEFDSFFNALKEIAIKLVENKINNFAEADGLAESLMDEEGDVFKEMTEYV